MLDHLENLLSVYTLPTKVKTFILDYFPETKLAKTGDHDAVDNLELNSIARKENMSQEDINLILKMFDAFSNSINRREGISASESVGNWMYLDKVTGRLHMNVSENYGEIEMGASVKESLEIAKKFYGNIQFRLVGDKIFVSESLDLNECKDKYSKILSECSKVIEAYDTLLSKYGAKLHNIKSHILLENIQDTDVLEFNIHTDLNISETLQLAVNPHVASLYETAMQYRLYKIIREAQKNSDRVLNHVVESDIAFIKVNSCIHDLKACLESASLLKLESAKEYSNVVESIQTVLSESKSLVTALQYIADSIEPTICAVKSRICSDDFWTKITIKEDSISNKGVAIQEPSVDSEGISGEKCPYCGSGRYQGGVCQVCRYHGEPTQPFDFYRPEESVVESEMRPGSKFILSKDPNDYYVKRNHIRIGKDTTVNKDDVLYFNNSYEDDDGFYWAIFVKDPSMVGKTYSTLDKDVIAFTPIHLEDLKDVLTAVEDKKELSLEDTVKESGDIIEPKINADVDTTKEFTHTDSMEAHEIMLQYAVSGLSNDELNSPMDYYYGSAKEFYDRTLDLVAKNKQFKYRGDLEKRFGKF